MTVKLQGCVFVVDGVDVGGVDGVDGGDSRFSRFSERRLRRIVDCFDFCSEHVCCYIL